MKHAVQIVRLNLLRTYAVEWDEETFVRDVWQNFYDATQDFKGVTVEEDVEARRVRIHGPVRFELAHVKYIGGTTKGGGGYAGQFGEGFKVCALVALRDLKVAFRAGAGTWRIEAAFEPCAVGEELVYRYWEDDDYDGSFLELTGCSGSLREALKGGRRFFRWAKSKSLGPCLFEDGTAFIYRSTGKKGEVYYCKQLRAETSATVRLAFCFDREVKGIRRDRDRRALTKPQVQMVVREVASRVPVAVAAGIVQEMRSAWEVGSPVLEAFIKGMKKLPEGEAWPCSFPDEWVAREAYGTKWHHANDEARRLGLKLGIEELGFVGMRRARSVIEDTTDLVEERELTALDRARRALLFAAGKLTYAGAFPPVRFARMTDTGGVHHGDGIRLAYDLLGGPFHRALSVYLHELCHEAGRDGSSRFSDALTTALAAVVAETQRVGELRACWDAVSKLDPAALDPVVRHGEGGWLVLELTRMTASR